MDGHAGIGAAFRAGCRLVVRRLLEPEAALIAAATLLPVVLFALAAWDSYRTTLRESEARVERTARILEEHALKVFETHRLVIQQVDGRLRSVDWARPEDRRDLHLLLESLQDELHQVATITVTDAAGDLRASGRAFPVDPRINFADRDYFKALARPDAPPFVVSRSYLGRQSGITIFNLAQRVTPPLGPAFDGVIAVSVDRGYFEHFYESVEPTFDHSVVLVRDDGAILARSPPGPLDHLPPKSAMLAMIRSAETGAYTRVSKLDGVERIFAYRKIGDYPVYVRFGISMHGALAPWRRSLFTYGLVASLASFALIGVSMLALRQTERERHARRRWQETAAALEAEAAERTKVEGQLRQAQKMEAVGRLTGGIAHDFNNLLTAVIGSLDLVRRRPDKIDARGLDLVGSALEGAHRAAALTGRLLAFSRQQPLQTTRLDANALVAGMSQLLRSTLGESIEVVTALDTGLWTTRADPNQLESAVLNLAVNARDAMPEGGKLTIATANVSSNPAAATEEWPAGRYVMIAVSDTGTGMTRDVIANIFEPFFTTKPVGKGTGLGLSQVYGFVKQSGGHLAVESEVGRGSTFNIYLPEAADEVSTDRPPAVAGPSRPAPGAVPHGNGETILVVEDDQMVRRLSVTTLEEAGYHVLAASDGPGGLALARREPAIALLFTDIVLGGAMDGRAMVDQILAARPGLPVLFTTGYTRDAIIRDGRLDDGMALIGKPFTGAALLAKVADLMRAARSAHAVPAL